MCARWRGSRPVSGSSRTSTARVVDDRLRHLHALAHPLRVGGQPPAVGRVELDRLERGARGAVGIREAVQHGRERDELACGQRLEHGLLLRHEADRPGHADVAARILAEHAHGALRRPGEPAEHAEHRRLAGAVRAEERGHARADVEADVRDGDERPNHFETPPPRAAARRRRLAHAAPPCAGSGTSRRPPRARSSRQAQRRRARRDVGDRRIVVGAAGSPKIR